MSEQETIVRPCPFCGERHIEFRESGDAEMCYLVCMSCGVETDLYMNDELAIKAWNMRTGEAQFIEMIKYCYAKLTLAFQGNNGWMALLDNVNSRRMHYEEENERIQEAMYAINTMLTDHDYPPLNAQVEMNYESNSDQQK